MPARRLTDLSDYKGVLPYSSELFGVYQTLIGWKSKRLLRRLRQAEKDARYSVLDQLTKYFSGMVEITFNQDCLVELGFLEPGHLGEPRPIEQRSRLLKAIAEQLPREPIRREAWRDFITPDRLMALLRDPVFPWYRDEAMRSCRELRSRALERDEPRGVLERRMNDLLDTSESRTRTALEYESKIAGVLLEAVGRGKFPFLTKLFYDMAEDSEVAFEAALGNAAPDFRDPFLQFDPRKDIKDVSLSPISIVHLFRQFFFEFDTFLGTPTGHVWLSPGSTVELIEVSTRREIVERSFEQFTESITKSERSSTSKEEISEAVKEENRNDLKLGISTTANQSWGTGSVTATASLSMDRTQQVARENTHTRMREQTEKLSSEIRQNYKSTFKTITEVSDTSSKRYLLTNTTQELINYELRRKMRQVGVQVQDIGSFLCWTTFVDEPGRALGLANLVHLAKPADLVPIPDQTQVEVPPDRLQTFTTNATWDFGDNRKFNDPAYGFVYLTHFDVPPAPDGFEIKKVDRVDIKVVSYGGEDSENQMYLFAGKMSPTGATIDIGVVTGPNGIEWDERIDFVVGGVVTYTASAAKRAEIQAANAAKLAAGETADAENQRRHKEAFVKVAKERIEIASNIVKRKYEELREEERVIVYRKLIHSLMTDFHYRWADNQTRHTLSELINAIFDVDKMLYFVAPEWWKPRSRAHFVLGETELLRITGESIVNWADSVSRDSNYVITDKSKPAPMGSSLGWILQLDGDNFRNAFLNAPWVKAVIPIRPGKEQAAIQWLQNVQVEGSDGMEATYAAPAAELAEIRAVLLAADPADPVGGHPQVTIGDAIRHLCILVARKHEQAIRPDVFPKGVTIHDDDKVSATPVDKVYEHGFYPLEGSFRFDPRDPDPANPDRNFQVFDQWIEILPTDQMVPVEVKYNPKTGRQI
jgi:hypothetical protein